MIPQQIIPNLLAFGGPKWGTEQNRDPNGALTYSDGVSAKHDQELGVNKGANMMWVKRQWSTVPKNQIGSGPLGIAYAILGSLPFAAVDGFKTPEDY